MTAIEDALLAALAARSGDMASAHEHICRAHLHARKTARRERQIVEIAALAIANDGERAAGLSLEHSAQFPDDTDLLAQLRGEATTEGISAKSAAEQWCGPESST